MIVRTSLLTLLAALFVLLSTPAWPNGDHSPVVELRDAQVLVEPYRDPLTVPDEASTEWRSIALTEKTTNPSHQLVRVWFRLTFRVDGQVTKPWAVLFPRLYTGGSVFLNGVLLDEVAGSSPTTQANWLRPHEFPLSVERLQQGKNTLLVAATSRYARIGIGVPMVGPLAAIRPIYQDRLFWEHTVALVSVWLLVVGSFFLLAIWFWRRQEVLYGIFGLAIFAWGIRTIHNVWPVIPLDIWVYWRAVYFAGTGFGIVLLCIFILRSGGFRHRWIERLAMAYAAAGPIAMLALGQNFEHWEVAWYAGAMLIVAFAALVTTRIAWHRRTWSAIALVAPTVIIFVTFVRDYAVKAGGFTFSNIYVAHIAAPAVVLAMCLVMLVRFIQNLARVENINIELEQRVSEREAEIKASHESLMRMELAQASAAERQRIMQDMHDGLGSQLLSSLSMVERGAAGAKEIAQVLRECIDDMRLVLDALSPDDNDLLSALGTLRFRMAPRLAVAGITLDWRVACPGETLELEPREGLAVLRIVQEGIANVLKHAGASQLAVTIDASADTLNVRIADDGKGFAVAAHESAPTGRGLSHLKKRAAAIGAALSITSSTTGTEISLSKPLH